MTVILKRTFKAICVFWSKLAEPGMLIFDHKIPSNYMRSCRGQVPDTLENWCVDGLLPLMKWA